MRTWNAVNARKVGKLDPVELEIRLRLKRWLRHFRERKRAQFPEDKEFADLLGISPSHLSNMLAENDRTPGLSLAVKMSEALQVQVDQLVKDEPPEKEPNHTPIRAFPAAAAPGRRKTGGGK